MAVTKKATISRWIGLSTDTKPTSVPIGSTFYEHDTKLTYTTHDGTNWVILALGYGLIFAGTCNSGMAASTTTIACADLAGYGNDYFNTQFYMQVVKNADSIGAAPDGDAPRKITDYVSSSGTFTVDAFSANVQESDEIYVMHKSIMLILAELPEAGDWALDDYDLFNVADADADNERWNPEYISGAAGGAADINTTTSGKLYIKASYNVAGAERYAVSKNLPIYADFFRVTEDLDITFGATDGATAKAVGIALSKGTAWDGTNYIVIERQKGTGVNRIQARSSLNGAAEVTTNVAVTDNAIALKVERLGQTWSLFYSTIQHEEGIEDWQKISEIEDPSNYMTNQVTFYQWAFNGTAGDATETAQGDFDNWYCWLGTGGGGQYIAGDYDSTWVAADIDGSVFERQEALQKAVNVTDAGTLTGFEEDGTGANLFNTLIAVQSVTTGAGTTTTIADTARTEGVNYWKDHEVELLGGSAVGQVVSIVGDDGAGVLTVRPAFTAAPGNAVAYAILKKLQPPVPGLDSTDNFQPGDVIGNKTDGIVVAMSSSASQVGYLKALLPKGQSALFGTCSTSVDTTHTTIAELANYNNNTFNYEYWLRVVYTTDGLAPLSEQVKVSGYTGSTGAFTHAAFTAAVAVSDKVMLFHKTHSFVLQCADSTDPVDMTPEVSDHSPLANLLTSDGDVSGYDRRDDSLEAIADKQGDTDQLTVPTDPTWDDVNKWWEGNELALLQKILMYLGAGDGANNVEITEDTSLPFIVRYLYNLADGASVTLDQVAATSILCKLATKGALGGSGATYNNTTDSLEALSDKVGAFTGNGGATWLDSVKAALDVIQGAFYKGTVTTATSGTDFATTDLVGHGDGCFIGWSVFCFRDAGGLGAAPQQQDPVAISAYTSATGAFTHTAFGSGTLAVGDEVVILSPGIAAIGDRTSAAATGAVTTTDNLIAYLKQVVTNTYRLAEAADGTDEYPASVAQDSLFAKLLAKGNPAVATTFNNTTDSLEAISDLIAGPTGIFHEQADTAVTYNTDDTEDTTLSLAAASTRYILRSLWLKFADPGANTITVRLKLLINDVSTTVASHSVTTANFGTYFSLFDMFGQAQVAGDSIIVTTQNSAVALVAVTGQYSYAKTNV